ERGAREDALLNPITSTSSTPSFLCYIISAAPPTRPLSSHYVIITQLSLPSALLEDSELVGYLVTFLICLIKPSTVLSGRSLRSLSRRSVEEEFPHLYAQGCTLRDICAECTKFVADVISSSRRSLDILNNTPKREAAAAAAAQRPQLERQSNFEALPQPNHHHLQPSPQLHRSETINSTKQ
ncbi:hypothetical protein GOODEAATRI_030038, partial [Goodea atripinnis]